LPSAISVAITRHELPLLTFLITETLSSNGSIFLFLFRSTKEGLNLGIKFSVKNYEKQLRSSCKVSKCALFPRIKVVTKRGFQPGRWSHWWGGCLPGV